MKFYNRLIPTSKSSSVSMQRLDSDFQIDDKNEFESELPTRPAQRGNPITKAKEMLSNVTSKDRLAYCIFVSVCVIILTVFFLGIGYFLIPWRVIFIGQTDIVTYSPPSYKKDDYKTDADLNFKAKLRSDLSNWNATNLDDPTNGVGQICIEAQSSLAKSCPLGLEKCSTEDITLSLYTLIDKLLTYTLLDAKPSWAAGMKSSRVLQMSSSYLKNNSAMSTILIINVKYDDKAPKLVYNKAVAASDQVGQDQLQQDISALVTPACKWVQLTVVRVTDLNTQIDLDSENAKAGHDHEKMAPAANSTEHHHEHNHG